ncbi:MAG: magnesium/cobalt transporter CorA [Chitinophagaceae bacterium]|nr:magnesium/cobalt transporter CorA [Chitinophagaceae bacterium]
MHPERFLKHLIKPIFNTLRTRQILNVNPTKQPVQHEAASIKICVYDYNNNSIKEIELEEVGHLIEFKKNNNVSWINIDGLKKSKIEEICSEFNIHPLIVEDILSKGQRPKMDEIDNIQYCLLNMLYFNDEHCSVEVEQISIVLGVNFVITFQEDPERDVFNVLREKLKIQQTKLRQKGADYLCYSLLDLIVDHYYVVMEKLGEKIELLEEEIIKSADVHSLARINNFRKEFIVLRRNVIPVRDLVNGFIKSESNLLDESVKKYFKDIYDHIIQANDLVDNYRDMVNNLQELYISKVNLKLNEVMKVIAVVTCFLAPATVIGGIFGMNFEVIPFAHSHWAFYFTVFFMLVIVPVSMFIIFKKRKWF